MKQLNEYFAAALKAEINQRPRGFRNRLAESTSVQASQITDIMAGKAYGSEERRRLLAGALGWEYEEFLMYGECLSQGREYVRAIPPAPAPELASYFAVSFHKRIVKVGHPGGSIYTPDRTESNQPLLLNKRYVDKQAKPESLAAFKMPDDSMDPTITKNRIIVVDTSDRVREHGCIFLLAKGNDTDQYSVKRVQLRDEEVYLVSDNPSKSPVLLRQAWNDVAVGRVIYKWLDPAE